MARRQKSQVTISLFPFLSILACVIGTLTLLITAMALGQMDNDTVISAEKYQKVIDQIRKDYEASLELRKKLDEIEAKAGDLLKKLADARVKLDELLSLKAALLARQNESKPDDEILVFDPLQAQKRLKELESEIQQQEEAKEKLMAEIKRRKEPPKEAEVMIQPSGSGTDLDPTFVECTPAGIAIYDGPDAHRVRRADLGTDETFLALLERIAGAEKKTIIFLVRDDGLGTYYAARDVANLNGARNGKLPVIGHGKLDLSLFEK